MYIQIFLNGIDCMSPRSTFDDTLESHLSKRLQRMSPVSSGVVDVRSPLARLMILDRAKSSGGVSDVDKLRGSVRSGESGIERDLG